MPKGDGTKYDQVDLPDVFCSHASVRDARVVMVLDGPGATAVVSGCSGFTRCAGGISRGPAITPQRRQCSASANLGQLCLWSSFLGG
jgi:hypothetical protein